MGSGKSTIGALLSKKMNMKFIDLDQKIETIEKQTISQIFKLKGCLLYTSPSPRDQ